MIKLTSKEAYIKIQEFINDTQLGIKRSSLDIIEPLNIIRELTKEQSNLTLLKCIKEWNEKGFDVDVYALEIVIHNCYIEFTIDLEDKKLFMEGEYNSFPYDVVHLLAKTLKALEVEECVK